MSRYNIALGKSPKTEKYSTKIQLVQAGRLLNVELISMYKEYHSDGLELNVFIKNKGYNDVLEQLHDYHSGLYHKGLPYDSRENLLLLCGDDIIFTSKDLKLLIKPDLINWRDNLELNGKIIHIEGTYTVRKSGGVTTRI